MFVLGRVEPPTAHGPGWLNMMRTAAAKRGVSLTCMARIVENWLNFTENGQLLA
jgi:hypothetical protein